MKIIAALKNEIEEIAWVTLYFFMCFIFLLTLKKLILADYRVEVDAVSTAAISALIAAKIVIVLEETPAGKHFDDRLPLVFTALYKTLAYILATFILFYLEKLFHAYRESDALSQAISEVWAHRNRNLIFAKVLCVGLTFYAYHLYAGLDRRLGKGTLRRLVTERPK